MAVSLQTLGGIWSRHGCGEFVDIIAFLETENLRSFPASTFQLLKPSQWQTRLRYLSQWEPAMVRSLRFHSMMAAEPSRRRRWHRLLLCLSYDGHLQSPKQIHTLLNTIIRRVQHCVALSQTRSHRFWYRFGMDLGCHSAPILYRRIPIWCRRAVLVRCWGYSSDSHVLDSGLQGQAECPKMSYIP